MSAVPEIRVGTVLWSEGLRAQLRVVRVDADVHLVGAGMAFDAPLDVVAGHVLSGRWRVLA